MHGARSNTGIHTTLGAASTHVSVPTQIADPRCASAKEASSYNKGMLRCSSHPPVHMPHCIFVFPTLSQATVNGSD